MAQRKVNMTTTPSQRLRACLWWVVYVLALLILVNIIWDWKW